MDLMKISEKYYDEMIDFIRKISIIPAPSGHEEKRAEFVLNYLKSIGFNNAYTDEAKNVIFRIGEESNDMVLFMAHTDIVFSEDIPLDYKDDGINIYCPGVTDDVACLAVLIAGAKYIRDNNLIPKKTLLFAANACEEGLGNLKGSRQIFKDYEGKISHMYTFDGMYSHVVNDSVGSHRYEVTALTEGGHSFGAFGNRNAINVLAGIIKEIYDIKVPVIGNSKTTYNVGIIEGGTSVNTIAQNAKMLVEYRSDSAECLAEMKKRYSDIFEKAKSECQELIVNLVGDRPCRADVNEGIMTQLTDKVKKIQEKYSGLPAEVKSGSTDCNIPHSLGIPAICVGVCNGGGAHTREEWLEKQSIKKGFAIGLELMLADGEVEV